MFTNDHAERLNLMCEDDHDKWDLSPNDLACPRSARDEIERLTAENAVLRECVIAGENYIEMLNAGQYAKSELVSKCQNTWETLKQKAGVQ